jgi:hypothetical protein
MAVAEATAGLTVPLSTGETHLEYLARNTQACVLRPYCFFVSWCALRLLSFAHVMLWFGHDMLY